MTTEQIGALAVAVLGTGGVGAWLVKEAIRIRDTLQRHTGLLDDMESNCEECRAAVNKQLGDGIGKFSEHDKLLNSTKIDILSAVSRSSENLAEAKERMMREFVTEANLEPKVLLIMRRNCRNCRGDT